MSEIKVELSPKTIFGGIVVAIGVIVIAYGVIVALTGVEKITELVGSEISYDEGFLRILGWFFALLIEMLGGFFLGIIGTRVMKK